VSQVVQPIADIFVFSVTVEERFGQGQSEHLKKMCDLLYPLYQSPLAKGLPLDAANNGLLSFHKCLIVWSGALSRDNNDYDQQPSIP